MSATNRKSNRKAFDEYDTPSWCVEYLLRELNLPKGSWLDPCGGNCKLIQAVKNIYPDVKIFASEIREACETNLAINTSGYIIGDYLKIDNSELLSLNNGNKFDVIITNPPYSIAMEFVEKALTQARFVVMLLRVNFVAAQKRNKFMRENAPDLYVLSRRPSFTDGGTDATEYAWFVWDSTNLKRAKGTIAVLGQGNV